MPSLKPKRLRGVAWLVDVDDVRPNPSCDHRTAVAPKPIRARLRMACTATCGSSAQAWTHRSPPESAGSIWSRWNVGSGASPAGRCAPRPSLSKKPGPTPNVSVSEDAGSPSASPVSDGGASGLRFTAPPGAASAPAVMRSAARVQRCSRSADGGPVGGGQVDRGEVQPVLRGRDDPGLVLPAERDHAFRRRCGRRLRRRRNPPRRRRPRPRPRRPPRRAGGGATPRGAGARRGDG